MLLMQVKITFFSKKIVIGYIFAKSSYLRGVESKFDKQKND
jgi:hypothetical protein